MRGEKSEQRGVPKVAIQVIYDDKCQDTYVNRRKKKRRLKKKRGEKRNCKMRKG